MADRAFGPKTADEEIVDLANDPRWQARLDEARARREQALAGKAPAQEKPRLKPWEEQDQDMARLVAEPFRESESRGMDLADRLERLKKRKSDDAGQVGHNGGPGYATPRAPDAPPREQQAFVADREEVTEAAKAEPVPKVAPAPVSNVQKLNFSPNSVFDEPTFQRSARDDARKEEDTVGEEEVTESLLLPVSEARRKSRDPATPRRPWLIADDAEEIEAAADAEPETDAEAPKRRIKAPFGLSAVVLAALVTPFFLNGPGLETGPILSPAPTFAVQAELGVPAPFVNWPAMSDSAARFYTFRGEADRVLAAVPARAPVFLRGTEAFESVAEGPISAPAIGVAPLAGFTAATPEQAGLPDALAGLQADEFGLNGLRLFLQPERPALRPDIPLVTQTN